MTYETNKKVKFFIFQHYQFFKSQIIKLDGNKIKKIRDYGNCNSMIHTTLSTESQTD